MGGIVQKPEMNGMQCTVMSFDDEAQKWVVELKGGRKARLPASNLAANMDSSRCASKASTSDVIQPLMVKSTSEISISDAAKPVAGPIASGLLLADGRRPSRYGQGRRPRVPRLECHIPEDGAILSPEVEVFRGTSSEGYPFRSKPVCLAGVVSVAMPNCNWDCRDSPVDRPDIDGDYEMLLRAKCTAMFAAAELMSADVVVVPKIGCGVFKNDPRLIGTI